MQNSRIRSSQANSYIWNKDSLRIAPAEIPHTYVKSPAENLRRSEIFDTVATMHFPACSDLTGKGLARNYSAVHPDRRVINPDLAPSYCQTGGGSMLDVWNGDEMV